MKTKQRLYYIDLLKAIGLTCIIIAHVNPPSWLFMFRNFDVPLMVIISSLLAEKSYQKYGKDFRSIFKYFISRIKRLVIPTWIFLTIYFIIRAIAQKELFSIDYYINTYLLTRYGFGYVWIILIYLYSALLVPLFAKFKFSYKSILAIVLIYILYEICYCSGIGVNSKTVETTFYYIIPYGLLTFLGYNFSKISYKGKYIIIAISFLLFAGLAAYYAITTESLQNVQIAKYPPRLYYLSYGVFCSFSLLCIASKIKEKYLKNKVIEFISAHSMWLYLWHILVLGLYEKLNLPKNWILKFIVVFSTSAIIVLTINKILDLIEKKRKFAILIYLRG